MAETATPSENTLLSPEFMRQLDRLDVISRKMLRGTMQGERRSKKRGQSVEFADYRNYVVGDDLRRIDWNLYARLDKLFLRLFLEEEDLSVSILLDTTASMDYGDPGKLLYAKRLAAALGYISLVHHNRVGLYPFTHTITGQLTGLRGRRPVHRLLNFLDQPPTQVAASSRANATDRPSDAGHFTEVCKRFALLNQRPGIVLLISDFLDKGDLADALGYLAQDKYDVYAIQVLSPQEVDPANAQLAGDLRLEDIEDGDIAEVSLSPALVKRYKATLQAYCNYVRDTCHRRGIAHMISQTSVPFETVVLKYLRQRGLLG